MHTHSTVLADENWLCFVIHLCWSHITWVCILSLLRSKQHCGQLPTAGIISPIPRHRWRWRRRWMWQLCDDSQPQPGKVLFPTAHGTPVWMVGAVQAGWTLLKCMDWRTVQAHTQVWRCATQEHASCLRHSIPHRCNAILSNSSLGEVYVPLERLVFAALEQINAHTIQIKSDFTGMPFLLVLLLWSSYQDDTDLDGVGNDCESLQSDM